MLPSALIRSNACPVARNWLYLSSRICAKKVPVSKLSLPSPSTLHLFVLYNAPQWTLLLLSAPCSIDVWFPKNGQCLTRIVGADLSTDLAEEGKPRHGHAMQQGNNARPSAYGVQSLFLHQTQSSNDRTPSTSCSRAMSVCARTPL